MKNTLTQRLIFIYNADSGVRSVILDSAHKIFSPDTYKCSLCDITYGAFTENSIWKNFRKETNLEMEFLHKDEFRKVYRSKSGHKFTFPILLVEGVNGLEVLVNTTELDTLDSTEQLIALVERRS